MGKAEDALRARREAANEAKRLEEAERQKDARLAIDELTSEIQHTLEWLEEHDWPGGELRFFAGGNHEERAMWNINPSESADHLTKEHETYLDSTGTLQRWDKRRGGGPVELTSNLLLQQKHDADSIRAQFTEPIRKMRQA